MHVVVDLPDPKPQGLDTALAKQFADIQRQLMGLVQSQQNQQDEVRADLLKAMRQQQESLVEALESLMKMVNTSFDSSQPSDALISAVSGLKQVMTSLPRSLKDALNHQYQSVQDHATQISVKPQVTISMPRGFIDRIDSLETAVLNGLRRSRNRTFGSNY